MTLLTRYRNLPVKRKLLLIIMVTVCAALATSSVAVLTYVHFVLRDAMRNDAAILADIYGSNSTAALAFGDRKAADELLSSLRAKRSITTAVLYTDDGKPFAHYHRPNAAGGIVVPLVQANGTWFDGDRLKLFRRIKLDGQTIGTIYLESDLDDVHGRIEQAALVLLAILLGAAALACVLAVRLQRTISKPIWHLSQAARHVFLNKDYKTRAVKVFNDDLGQLTDGFNEMLAEIERRDQQLLANQGLLEQKVADRTAELALAKDKAETACVLLEESRARLSMALDGASEALWDWDIVHKRAYYSDRWSQMLGFTPEEIGDSAAIWNDLVHPEDYASARQALDQHVAGETESYQAEYRMRRKDGGWIWIQARGRVVERAADGSPTRIAGTHLDVTARKTAEQELARQHDILDNLIESVPDRIYFKDRSSAFIRVNRALMEFFGSSDPGELLGKTDADFFTAEHAAPARADELDLLEGRLSVVSKEEKETWPDGRETWAQTNKLPLRDHAGNIIGTFGISRDITERKRMEQALLTAKEAAEAASRAKSEFLANMSHEIRTPMNGIIGMTELAMDTELTEEQRDYLKTVRSSGESLLTIINDILDFSKIEAGKLSLDKAEFDLDDLLQDTVRAVAVSAHQKGLELLYENRAALPAMVEGDAGRVRQIVTNLLGNALKFTAFGEVRLQIREVSREENVLELEFTVSDTGIGISPAWQERIFEAFVQADASNTRSYGGTGLGLAICSRLVALMEGRIWLESQVGEGSTFHFTAKLGISTANRPEVQSATPEELHGLNVLVVDDNATNRRILQETLIGWKMKPVLAESGARALELMRGRTRSGDRFDLILLDAQMPEMDGFTLARRIQEDVRRAGPRIMMLSSVDIKWIGSGDSDLGLSHYLVKPVTRVNLLKAILKVMGQRHTPVVPSTPVEVSEPVTSLRVLVAEDNPVNQRVASLLLQKAGHSVVMAANGSEALEALARATFDLVLMDVQMPVMNGYEATREIRKREQPTGQHVPVIALTAHAIKGDREACLEAGMDDYLSKPIQTRDLYQILERWSHHGAPDQIV